MAGHLARFEGATTYETALQACGVPAIAWEVVQATADGFLCELFYFGHSGRDPVTILWVPDIGRAACHSGGATLWTDARGPDDALFRYLNGEMTD